MSDQDLAAYLGAAGRFHAIDEAWRKELAKAAAAINAKWAARREAAHNETLEAYMKVMPSHQSRAEENGQ